MNSEMEIKITDFGFATYYEQNKTKGYGGTLSYMAPEVSELKLYDGLLMYGKAFFSGWDMVDVAFFPSKTEELQNIIQIYVWR